MLFVAFVKVLKYLSEIILKQEIGIITKKTALASILENEYNCITWFNFSITEILIFTAPLEEPVE